MVTDTSSATELILKVGIMNADRAVFCEGSEVAANAVLHVPPTRTASMIRLDNINANDCFFWPFIRASRYGTLDLLG
jgi:hypothetical protein